MTRVLSRLILLVALAVQALATATCRVESGASSDLVSTCRGVSGPEGTALSCHGTTLDIPKGALDHYVDIHITVGGSSMIPESLHKAISLVSVVKLNPSGLTFKFPAKLTVQMPLDARVGQAGVLYHRESDTFIRGMVGPDGKFVALLPHFSTLGVVDGSSSPDGVPHREVIASAGQETLVLNVSALADEDFDTSPQDAPVVLDDDYPGQSITSLERAPCGYHTTANRTKGINETDCMKELGRLLGTVLLNLDEYHPQPSFRAIYATVLRQSDAKRVEPYLLGPAQDPANTTEATSRVYRINGGTANQIVNLSQAGWVKADGFYAHFRDCMVALAASIKKHKIDTEVSRGVLELLLTLQIMQALELSVADWLDRHVLSGAVPLTGLDGSPAFLAGVTAAISEARASHGPCTDRLVAYLAMHKGGYVQDFAGAAPGELCVPRGIARNAFGLDSPTAAVIIDEDAHWFTDVRGTYSRFVSEAVGGLLTTFLSVPLVNNGEAAYSSDCTDVPCQDAFLADVLTASAKHMVTAIRQRAAIQDAQDFLQDRQFCGPALYETSLQYRDVCRAAFAVEPSALMARDFAETARLHRKELDYALDKLLKPLHGAGEEDDLSPGVVAPDGGGDLGSCVAPGFLSVENELECSESYRLLWGWNQGAGLCSDRLVTRVKPNTPIVSPVTGDIDTTLSHDGGSGNVEGGVVCIQPDFEVAGGGQIRICISGLARILASPGKVSKGALLGFPGTYLSGPNGHYEVGLAALYSPIDPRSGAGRFIVPSSAGLHEDKSSCMKVVSAYSFNPDDLAALFNDP